jgi:regulator of CtrA degradation
MAASDISPTQPEELNAFADGKVFERVFTEGMGLVEETASYLDGPGREQSKTLEREANLTYASWSMELTTRLMQAASSLVMQKAVKDGEMRREDAAGDKYRLTRDEPALDASAQAGNGLPPRFLELVTRTEALFERICRLDVALYATSPVTHGASPVIRQMRQLQQAAETGAFDPLSIWGRVK